MSSKLRIAVLLGLALSLGGPAVASSAAGASAAPTAAAARARLVRHARLARRCPNANRPAASISRAAARAALLCLVNRERAAHGLPRLVLDRRLNHSAQGWTDTMVATDTFSHGADFASRITAAGFRWSAAGENIATGFPTARAVLAAWMASPGHCRNILDPAYRDIGIGISRHPIPGWASGPSTWTEDFALPVGARAPSGNWRPADGCPY
jgi:uncharacterized protein YkwD